MKQKPSNEEIEDLLQHFGETLQYLPEPEFFFPVYDVKDIDLVGRDATIWHAGRLKPFPNDCKEYICHLYDVIFILVKALETARTKLTSDRNLEDRDAVRVQQENIQEKV